MAASVKTRLIKIGNSHGIRIPKPLIEQAGLADEVELEVETGRLIVRPSRPPRHGWEERFRAMAQAGDDALLDAPLPPTQWETEEWEW